LTENYYSEYGELSSYLENKGTKVISGTMKNCTI
jgi:hypothetical protein